MINDGCTLGAVRVLPGNLSDGEEEVVIVIIALMGYRNIYCITSRCRNDHRIIVCGLCLMFRVRITRKDELHSLTIVLKANAVV